MSVVVHTITLKKSFMLSEVITQVFTNHLHPPYQHVHMPTGPDEETTSGVTGLDNRVIYIDQSSYSHLLLNFPH